jgi:hypothetical protein
MPKVVNGASGTDSRMVRAGTMLRVSAAKANAEEAKDAEVPRGSTIKETKVKSSDF